MKGVSVVSELPKMMYKYQGDEIVPILFCENNYELEKDLNISCQTLYPQNGTIKYVVKNATGINKTLKIRKPYQCKKYTVDTDSAYSVSSKFIDVPINQGKKIITVNFEIKISANEYLKELFKTYIPSIK